MRRPLAVLAATSVMAVLHACSDAVTPLCACSIAVPVSGRWVGSTSVRDSVDLTIVQAPGEPVVSGSGRVIPPTTSSLSARTVTVAGSLDPSTYSLARLTIYGWYDEPLEWRSTTRWDGTSLSGTMRLPAHVRGGDTITLALRRVGP